MLEFNAHSKLSAIGLVRQVNKIKWLIVKEPRTIKLGQIATARSGDKGNHANIGVVALTPTAYDYLCSQLTADRVREYFKALDVTDVQRFELPRVGALNFLLKNALAGGASRSLRIDSQGKLLGTAILDLKLPEPDNLSEMVATT